MASTMIRQAASANREHQARIRSIQEDVKCLQSRIDALNASAPLPRALEDVRKLMAEHKDDVRGTEKIERTMNTILQKLLS
jgi:3-hydroxyisobutyrate dehydrogenase-like beta-hydroxyacid dehydrogenase